MMDRLTVGCSLRNRVFAATTMHMNLIHDITLLRLLSQGVLYQAGAGGAGGPVKRRVLPAVHPGKEVHYIGLLLDVPVITHIGLLDGCSQMEEPFSHPGTGLKVVFGNTPFQRDEQECLYALPLFSFVVCACLYLAQVHRTW